MNFKNAAHHWEREIDFCEGVAREGLFQDFAGSRKMFIEYLAFQIADAENAQEPEAVRAFTNLAQLVAAGQEDKTAIH